MALTNWEIAVYALYLRGGASRSVHTEDVALKCFELAPDSFSWVKHRQYPDKEVARKGLVDARAEKNLVTGRTGRGKGQSSKTATDPALDGWQLTDAGVRWVMENEDRLAHELQERQPKGHRQELLQKLSRIRGHGLFKKFQDQPAGFVPSLGSLAELLRCRVDAERSVWEKRFATLRNEARLANQGDVVTFLDICQKFVNSDVEVQR